jgi:ComEC/Rec2-related protein
MAKALIAAWGIAGFLVGIGGSGFHLERALLGSVAGIFIAGAVMRRHRTLLFAMGLGLVFGLFYYHLYFALRTAGRVLPSGSAFAAGIIVNEPSISGRISSFQIALQPPFRGRIAVVSMERLHYGDRIVFKGNIQQGSTERDLPVAKFPMISAVEGDRGNRVRAGLLSLKYRVLAPAHQYFSAEQGAYLEGLLLGYKNDFTAALKEDMKKSGTTHLIALSGYNVSIIILSMQKLFYGRVPRRMNFWITLSLLAVFTLMVGGEPSIVRAVIMGSLFLIAAEIGRLKSFGIALLWTAFLMILFDPGSLFLPGFLLSYGSLLGIVYLAPAILAVIAPHPTEGWRYELWSHAALTLAAQLAVLPILLAVFGSIAPVSFLANLIILPFIPVTMLLGFIFLAMGLVVPFMAVLVAKISAVFLGYELGIIHAAAQISHPVMAAQVSFPFVALYYVFLAAFVVFSTNHAKRIS